MGIIIFWGKSSTTTTSSSKSSSFFTVRFLLLLLLWSTFNPGAVATTTAIRNQKNPQPPPKKTWLEQVYEQIMMVGPATTTPPQQEPKDPTRQQRSPFYITPGLPGMGLQWAKRQRRPPQPQPLMAGNHAATMETTNTTIDNGDSADEKEEEEEEEDVWMLSVQILGDNRHNQLRQVLEEQEQQQQQQQQQQGSSGGGFQITSCGTYRCHALMDLKRFPEIHGLPGVLAMEPNVVETSSSAGSHSGRLQPQPDRFLAGLVRSEAYESLHVDQVRERFGFTGTGLKIGILSDSFDLLRGYNRDVETGDLPDRDRMELVYEYPFFSATDEGRAMMQLLYDLLPNATFAFATGFVSPEDFAQNIQALANVGCDLIVDDVTWFTEPFFQHGVVAQSANDVAEIRGIPYFSAAGNYGRQSWQSPFVGSGILDDNGCELHAFGPPQQQQKQQLNQTITFAPQDRLVFQWADHFYSVNGPPGAQTDMNLQFYRRNGELYASFTADNVGIDPVILFTYSGEEEREEKEEEVNLQMTISHCSGPPPTWMKWLGNTGRSWFPSEFATDSPTLFGHKNTPFVAAVGAALYQNTPAFGTNPPVVQDYSSVGGLPLLYDRDGTPIGGRRTGRGRIYRQPRFVATHGVANTFFGPLDYKEPNGFAYYFFGTSAAAPNAAAVGALLLQANPELTPLELYRIMETTTIDMDKPGFDFETGFGFIDAYAAVSSLLFTTPSNAPTTANATTTAPAPTFVTATPTTTAAPTTETPTSSPTKMQTARPTKSPITPAPTSNPMDTPTTLRPTIFPPTTTEPSAPPTANPTWSPTSTPSFIPSVAPGTTAVPTQFLDCPAVSACNDGTCGNCQQPRVNETGCSCAGCECQVCALDPFCCESFWDGLCGITAMSLCRDCVNGGGNHDTTNNNNNNAVSNVSAKTTMSSSTATAATSTMTTTTLAPSTCFDTPSTCGPQEDDGSFSCGNCLDLRGNETGCSCPGCACRVCAMDSFCCNNFWDRQCVDTAQDICNCPNNINNV